MTATITSDLIFSTADHGWLAKCQESISKETPFSISLKGADALNIIGFIHSQVNSIPWSLFPKLPKNLHIELPKLNLEGIDIPTEMVAVVLGSVGALGGALGSVAFCATMAAVHGMRLNVKVKINNLFDVMNNEVILSFAK